MTLTGEGGSSALHDKQQRILGPAHHEPMKRDRDRELLPDGTQALEPFDYGIADELQ